MGQLRRQDLSTNEEEGVRIRAREQAFRGPEVLSLFCLSLNLLHLRGTIQRLSSTVDVVLEPVSRLTDGLGYTWVYMCDEYHTLVWTCR